jgi:hypothetical protein
MDLGKARPSLVHLTSLLNKAVVEMTDAALPLIVCQ